WESVPAFTVTLPVNVFDPLSRSIPGPDLVSDWPGDACAMFPLMVSVLSPATLISGGLTKVIVPERVLAPDTFNRTPLPPTPVPVSVIRSGQVMLPVTPRVAPAVTVVPIVVAPRALFDPITSVLAVVPLPMVVLPV